MFGWLRKKSPSPGSGPDFSEVTTDAKAEALFRRGDLEKLYLIPLEFGGPDSPENFLYVPVGVADIKSEIDNNVIAPLIAEGKLTQYKTDIKYQGSSLIPSALTIIAFNPGEFTTTINIWGDALEKK